jgi:hypothetical protein
MGLVDAQLEVAQVEGPALCWAGKEMLAGVHVSVAGSALAAAVCCSMFVSPSPSDDARLAMPAVACGQVLLSDLGTAPRGWPSCGVEDQ